MTNQRVILQKDPPEVIAERMDCAVHVCLLPVLQVLGMISSFNGMCGFSGANLINPHQADRGVEVLLHTNLSLT